MNPLLVTMRGPGSLDVRNLSNFEAGIAFLTLLNQLAPGLTFGQLARAVDGGPERLSGWFTDLKKAVGSVKDGIGDVLKSTWETVGGSAGDAVRLVTDDKVIDGASRLGTAYATGGGSEGVRSILGGDGGAVDQLLGFISNLGSSFKSQAAAGAPMQAGVMGGPLVWIIGGGLVLFLATGRRR